MILMPISTWSAFKTLISDKGLQPQFSESQNQYELFAEEKSFVWNMAILKGGSDATDFENNYKAIWNKPLIPDTDAYAKTDRFAAACIGFYGTATAGQTSSLDYTMSADRYLVGVSLICKDQAFGDTVKFQIVHPQAGVVNEFATDWNISADTEDQGIVEFPLRGKIPAGLKVRVSYTSVGGTNVSVRCNLILHKKV